MTDGRRWAIAFSFCAALAALPFLTTYRMPMNDLPQHAAQISIWKFFDAPCYRFGDVSEVNLLTPYLVGYSIARALTVVVPVNGALKVTIWLTVLALPLVMRQLARRSGVDEWIAFIGFPLAFGFSFYWGFLNFLVALPFGLLLIWVQDRHAEVPRLRSAWAIGAIGLLLVACHAVAFAVFAGIAGLVQLVRSRSARTFVAGIAPLVIPAVALMMWTLQVRHQSARAQAPMEWGLSLDRVSSFPSMLLGATSDIQATVTVIVLIGAALLTGMRPSRDWRRWVPATAAAAAYLLIPFSLFGQIFMHERFAVAAVALAILGVDRGEALLRRPVARALLVAVSAMWMIVLAARFHGFDREARGFDRLVDIVPANQHVLLLNVVTQSESVPGIPFLHFAGYYQQRKGGLNAWSFANNFPSLIRYRRDAAVPRVPPVITYDPRYFRWQNADGIDWFFVHAPGEMRALLFGGQANEVQLRARSGDWWLYSRIAAARSSCVPLEPDDLDRRPIIR